MKIGDKVQVWSEEDHTCLGWGIIILIASKVKDLEDLPFIQLYSGEKIWGDRCYWITEKKAIEVGVRLFHDIFKEPGS